MSRVTFYEAVFRDILQCEYDMDNKAVLDQWQQLVAAHPLPQNEHDGPWQTWGGQMLAWLGRLVDQGN